MRPVLYGAATCAWDLLCLAVRLPLETCLRRLQLQRATAAYRPAVRGNSRLTPYDGFRDCLLRIAAEEGVAGLYRGALPHVVLSVTTNVVYYGIARGQPDYILRI